MPMPLFGAGQRVTGAKLKALADAIDTINAQLAPSWSTITLLAGWTNRAGYAVAGYRKIAGGTVLQIVLNLSAGTTANGTTIFTLPSGFRPITTAQMNIATRIAAAPQQMGALEISASSGDAKIFDIGASATLHASGIIPMDR